MPQQQILRAIRDVEKARRDFRRFVVGFAISILLLLGAVIYVVAAYQPKTACERDPDSRECQRLTVARDQARNVRSACVILHKAGYKCPVGDVRKRIEHRKDKADNNKEKSSNEPASRSSSSTGTAGGSEPSSPGSPGSVDGGTSGGNGPSGPPSPPAPPSPPSPPTPSPNPPSPPSPPAPSPNQQGPVGNAVDQVTDIGCQVTTVLGVCIK